MATLTKSVPTISGSANYTYRCVVTENSYNIANNTSNVTVTFSIAGPWAASFYEWSTSYGIIIDGSVKKTGSSSPYISTSYVTLLTWTGNITHSSDGSKNISVGVYLTNGSANYLPKQYTSNSPLSMGSVTLTTIPRASAITSVGNVTLGNKCNVKWTPASAAFKYKLKFSLGGWSYTTDFISPNSTNAYTYANYTIPNTSDLLDDIPNSTTGTMTATLTTYNSSGTQIGSTNSKAFTVTVPSSVVPIVGTITLNPVDITTKDGTSRNILVQGKNQLMISVSGCSAGTGSTIRSYTFSGPGISIATTNTSATTTVLSNTGTLTYTIKVTDRRGRTASKTATINCYAYSAPYFKSFSAIRTDANGNADTNGTYIKCSYDLGYSPVNGTNNATVKIMYKQSTASAYSSVVAQTSSTNTSGSKLLSSMSENSTYTIYATIIDNYSGTKSTKTVSVSSVTRVMNITSDGTGIAFGKMAESSNLFDCKWPIKTAGSYVATKPVTLYNSASGGEDGSITLSENVINYEYLEIYYADESGYVSADSIRFCSPNNKTIDLTCTGAQADSGKLYIKTSRYTVIDNKLTFIRSKHVTLTDGVLPTITESTTNNNIKILRVVGFN